MKSPRLIIVKLGGSLITDKAKPYTLQENNMHNALSTIRRAREEMPDIFWMIGNGAGSFAHQSAHRFGTAQGFTDDEGRLGACITHADAVHLNQILVRQAHDMQLPFFSFHPASFIKTHHNQPNTFFFDPLLDALTHGLIPSFYGDVIVDKKNGSTIYSTDKLCALIAEHAVQKQYDPIIIHAGNYDGVLDENGTVIDVIHPDTADMLINQIQIADTVDVTGGMHEKVKEMLRLATIGIPSIILNGTKPDNLYHALCSKKITGTHILP